MPISIIKQEKPAIVPQAGCNWADTMVLNPAIVRDKFNHETIHMLFRSTGPYPQKQIAGKPLPYPIFLGYAKSVDNGKTWEADFSKPALTPALATEINDMFITDAYGRKAVNYANGCIEDPRFFEIKDELMLSTACRLFPPGPYWENDDPMQCAPQWAGTPGHPFGKAADENVTVNVLWKVNLDYLSQGKYEKAFRYYCNLTNPEFGEDRDVFPFPEKFNIDGKMQYVLLSRPFNPGNIPGFEGDDTPSIFISCAEKWSDFAKHDNPRKLFAKPEFDWENSRIGASSVPIRLNDSEWLLPYHGKQDNIIGYTQSFMILEDNPNGFPNIKHRCSERLFTATEEWEMPQKFPTPCVFTTGMINDDDSYIISYGAADEFCGICRINKRALENHLLDF